MNSSEDPRKIPIWLKALGFLCLVGALASFMIHLFSVNPAEVVQKQLSSLKNKKITEAYYAFTSKEFQSNTSLEDFQTFVRQYPFILNYTSASITEQEMEKNTGGVLVDFFADSEREGQAIFNLVKENKQWKILGIEVLSTTENEAKDPSITGELIAPIELQLHALQNYDILGAYKDLVSKHFQSQMPFDKFKIYVLKHPILTQFKRFDFKEHYLDGNHGVVTVLLNPDLDSISVKYKLIKEDKGWKIDLMKVLTPSQELVPKTPDSTGLISTVEQLLSTFKKGNYEGAYNQYIDELVKKDTPFETFKRFIRNYPAFANYRSINIKEPQIDEKMGHLIVDLLNDEGVTTVEFALKFTGNDWKVEGMHVVNIPSIAEQPNTDQSGKSFKTRELLSMIQGFLNSLRSKEEDKAYKQFTSQNFKYTNSPEDFQKFLKSHPELATSSSSSFEKLMFNNNIATFSGKLFLSDRLYMPIEFDLIQEDGKWKILNIFTFPPAEISPETRDSLEAAQSVPIEFTKILLGTSVNDEGNVEHPTTSFRRDSGDINMNLFIKNGVAGTKVEIVVRHVESNSEIPPVNSVLTGDGESELSFVFSPPPHGWPKGSYQVRVSSSTKVYKTFSYKVE